MHVVGQLRREECHVRGHGVECADQAAGGENGEWAIRMRRSATADPHRATQRRGAADRDPIGRAIGIDLHGEERAVSEIGVGHAEHLQARARHVDGAGIGQRGNAGQIPRDLQRPAIGERTDDPVLCLHGARIAEIAGPLAQVPNGAAIVQHSTIPAAVGRVENGATVARHIAVPGRAGGRPVCIGARNVRDKSGIGLDIAVPGAAGIVNCPCIVQHLAVPEAAIPDLVGIAAHVATPDRGFAVHDAARIGDHIAVPVAATAVEDPVGVAVDVADPIAYADLVGPVVVDDMAGIAEDIAPPGASGIGDAARFAIAAKGAIADDVAVPGGVLVVVDPAIVGEHVAGPDAGRVVGDVARIAGDVGHIDSVVDEHAVIVEIVVDRTVIGQLAEIGDVLRNTDAQRGPARHIESRSRRDIGRVERCFLRGAIADVQDAGADMQCTKIDIPAQRQGAEPGLFQHAGGATHGAVEPRTDAGRRIEPQRRHIRDSHRGLAWQSRVPHLQHTAIDGNVACEITGVVSENHGGGSALHQTTGTRKLCAYCRRACRDVEVERVRRRDRPASRRSGAFKIVGLDVDGA